MGLDIAQRPSKVLIVNECIRELEQLQALYNTAMQNIRELTAEKERLTVEVNSLRSQTSNLCACTASADVPANMEHRSIDLHNGVWSHGASDVCNVYGSTSSTSAALIAAPVQSEQFPDMPEHYLQAFMSSCQVQGEFPVEH